MKNPSGNTHRADAVDPVDFRAQATGIGQSLEASRATGLRRSQRVIDCAPKAQRADVTRAQGYPAPTPSMGADGRLRHPDTGVILSPVPLGRG